MNTTLRVRVISVSETGNPRELITLCRDQAEADKRVAMYTERFPGADIFVEEVKE